jgi:multidrug efflux pump
MFDIFIKRPVLASVISLLILILGLRALTMLPVRQYPEMTNTVITVTTTYPGADAALMQGFVTEPIQKAVSTAKGIDYLTSTSMQGVSTIKANIKLNEDPAAAMTEVTSKVSEVRSLLPRGINDPVIKKTTGQSFPSMFLAFYAETMTPQQITDYVTRVVQPKLSTVPGVANPQIMGGQNYSMRVWLNPEKMAQYAISPEQVRAALTANNYQSAAGTSKGAFDVISTQALTDLRAVDDFRRLVVRSAGTQLVRLGDVAEVALGPENTDASVFVNGQKAVFVGVFTTPDANPLTVVSDVRAMLPAVEKQLPPGMSLKVAYDSTIFIRASIKEVVKTIAEAALIVIVVIFLFMGSFRSVAIPLVTVPLSLIGVALFLLALGFSINLLTLLAMVLAIGLVVDDAIVVVENVHRHIEDGETPFRAALHGTREIAGPVISMTITLAAVYAPIAFLGGLTGSLFKEFALTLAGSVIVSGIIALTLSPMMCSKVLRHDSDRTGLPARIDRAFEGVRNRYMKGLRSSLTDRPTTILFALIVLGSLPFLYLSASTELAPEEDQGAVLVSYSGPASANRDYLETFGRDINQVFVNLPETDSSFIINGYPNRTGGFAASVLKPWDQRERKQKVLTQELQKGLNDVAGVRASAFSMPALPGSDGLPVQFVITSTVDHRALLEATEQIITRAKKSGLFAFVDGDLKFESPQTVVEIDRDKAAAYGISMQQIGDGLATLTGGNYVNLVNLQGRSYQVIPQVPREFRISPEALGRFHLNTSTGAAIPLSALVSLRSTVEPVSLSQFNQQNAVTVMGFPMPGVTLGTALEMLKSAADEVLPAGYTIDYGGQSRQYQQEGNALALTFVFALAIIFLVLAAQFESFRDPLVIMVSVPLSICGALIPLALGLTTMNIYTQVGLVTLIGLITKHGILICEVAREQQENAGLSRLEAVAVAASLRLRPILMTTAAMVAGLVPLMFASGAGAASRFSIAVVIIAGMTVGTLFTLFVLPVVYTFVATDRSRLQQLREEREMARAAE